MKNHNHSQPQVKPADIIHAEVERRYGYSPIYCFLVGAHPLAVEQAKKRKVEIRQHRLVKSLLEDVRQRCVRVQWRVAGRDAERREKMAVLRESFAEG